MKQLQGTRRAGHIPTGVDPRVLEAARLFGLFKQVVGKDLHHGHEVLIRLRDTARTINKPKLGKLRSALLDGDESRLEQFFKAGVFIDPTDWQVNPILARNILGIPEIPDIVIANPSEVLSYLGLFNSRHAEEQQVGVILNASGMNLRLRGMLEELGPRIERKTFRNFLRPPNVFKKIKEEARQMQAPFEYAVQKAAYYLFCKWVIAQHEIYPQETHAHMLDVFFRTVAMHELGHAYFFKTGHSEYTNMAREEERAYLTEMAFGNPLFTLLDTSDTESAHDIAIRQIIYGLFEEMGLKRRIDDVYAILELNEEALRVIAMNLLERNLKSSFGKPTEEVIDVPTLERVFNSGRLLTPELVFDVFMTPEM